MSIEPGHGYRSLFFAYPTKWRAEHEDVVLDTLLSLHADMQRPHPSLAERIWFAADGIRVQIAAARPKRQPRRFATAAALAPLRTFDQTNGVVQDAEPLDAWTQVRANASAGRNADEQRVAPFAWFTLDAASRPGPIPRTDPIRKATR